jgi:hypothetical protein
MLIPGTYTCRGGLIAKIYDVVWSQGHGCHIAVGAKFTSAGTFLSPEFWRASDGRFFTDGRESVNDIDASFSALPTTNRNAA